MSEDLKLENIYKRYKSTDKKKKAQDPYAVQDLNLNIKQGSFVSILGPSGCGKSTTLRMIAGLEEITKGHIFIGDTDIGLLPPKDRNIGLAFEDYALYPPLTVYENIAYCLRAKKVDPNEIDTRVRDIAKVMKIDDLLDSKVKKLSGGQKQRVNIARALVRKPKVLLLDEPLSHLDGKMRQLLRNEIKRIHNEIKCTTILVTHDQIEAVSLADYIAVMDHGILQQYGTTKEIYENPANEFVATFIGEPPMNILNVAVVEHENYGLAFKLDNNYFIRVPRQFYGTVKIGDCYRLGVRPTSITILNNDAEDFDAELVVDLYEFLGEESTIGIKISDILFNILFYDNRRFKPGDKVKIKINYDLLYLFNPQNGSRVYIK